MEEILFEMRKDEATGLWEAMTECPFIDNIRVNSEFCVCSCEYFGGHLSSDKLMDNTVKCWNEDKVKCQHQCDQETK